MAEIRRKTPAISAPPEADQTTRPRFFPLVPSPAALPADPANPVVPFRYGQPLLDELRFTRLPSFRDRQFFNSGIQQLIPIRLRRLHELEAEPKLVFPQYLPVVVSPPAAATSLVIAFRYGQDLLTVEPKLVAPQVFAFPYQPPAPAPANPVIGYRLRNMEELSHPVQIPIASFFPFPYTNNEIVVVGTYVWHPTRRNQRL